MNNEDDLLEFFNWGVLPLDTEVLDIPEFFDWGVLPLDTEVLDIPEPVIIPVQPPKPRRQREPLSTEALAFIDRVRRLSANNKTKFDDSVKKQLAEGLALKGFDFTPEQTRILLDSSPKSIRTLILNWTIFTGLGFVTQDSIVVVSGCRSIDFNKLSKVNTLWQGWINQKIPRSDILKVISNRGANYNMDNIESACADVIPKIKLHMARGNLTSISDIELLKWMIAIAGRQSGAHALEVVSQKLDGLVRYKCTLKDIQDLVSNTCPAENVDAFFSLSRNGGGVLTLSQRIALIGRAYGHYAAAVVEKQGKKLVDVYKLTAEEILALPQPSDGTTQIEGIVAFYDALNERLATASNDEKINVYSNNKEKILAHFKSNAWIGKSVLNYLSETKFEPCTVEKWMESIFNATKINRASTYFLYAGERTKERGIDDEASKKKMKLQ